MIEETILLSRENVGLFTNLFEVTKINPRLRNTDKLDEFIREYKATCYYTPTRVEMTYPTEEVKLLFHLTFR